MIWAAVTAKGVGGSEDGQEWKERFVPKGELEGRCPGSRGNTPTGRLQFSDLIFILLLSSWRHHWFVMSCKFHVTTLYFYFRMHDSVYSWFPSISTQLLPLIHVAPSARAPLVATTRFSVSCAWFVHLVCFLLLFNWSIVNLQCLFKCILKSFSEIYIYICIHTHIYGFPW